MCEEQSPENKPMAGLTGLGHRVFLNNPRPPIKTNHVPPPCLHLQAQSTTVDLVSQVVMLCQPRRNQLVHVALDHAHRHGVRHRQPQVVAEEGDAGHKVVLLLRCWDEGESFAGLNV